MEQSKFILFSISLISFFKDISSFSKGNVNFFGFDLNSKLFELFLFCVILYNNIHFGDFKCSIG